MIVPVGIDLGTTNSVVARVGSGGKAEVIADPAAGGDVLVPSVVSFASGAPVVGPAAKADEAAGESEVASLFKRMMGNAEYARTFGGADYDATALSALVLTHLKVHAERGLGMTVTQAVITVPAYFTHPQRAATVEAGDRAGLEVMKIISEPTAAALSYRLRDTGQGGKVLVYDLGGGTFDVSIVEISSSGITVVATDGDHYLGGQDWDDRLAAHLNQMFTDEFGIEVDEDDEGVLKAAAQRLKHSLSTKMSAPAQIGSAGRSGRYEVSREQFEQMTADLLDRTFDVTARALEAAGIGWADLTGVVPVGGSSRLPMVRDRLTRESSRPPLTGVHPDHAVALGAALEAAAEADRISARGSLSLAGWPGGKRVAATDVIARDAELDRLAGRPRLADVVAHSLGMIAESEDRSRYINSVLIGKNLPIPADEHRPYQFEVHKDEENLLEVFLTQGETDDPAKCAYLGRYLVTGLAEPESGSATTVIDIGYAYDHNGMVSVSASGRGSGQPLTVTVDKLPPDIPDRFLRPPTRGGGRRHAVVYLAFDLSGSMSGHPLVEAKRAAREFVSQCDLTRTSVGLIGFSDDVRVNQQATQNDGEIKNAIDGMRECETGIGNLGDPFDEIYDLLTRADDNALRYGIVLADGVWSYQGRAEQRAKRCHQSGIEIIAIGFGGADRAFLKRIASSDEQGMFTSLNQLTDVFSTIARELIESGSRRVGSRALRFGA
jgi:molecular chaperone DnaK (HSP70)